MDYSEYLSLRLFHLYERDKWWELNQKKPREFYEGMTKMHNHFLRLIDKIEPDAPKELEKENKDE